MPASAGETQAAQGMFTQALFSQPLDIGDMTVRRPSMCPMLLSALCTCSVSPVLCLTGCIVMLCMPSSSLTQCK